MARLIYALIWMVGLMSQKCMCGSPTQSVSNIQDAMVFMEEMIDRMDQALRDMHIYRDEYSPWSECSASCGIGYKWREKIGCDSFVSGDCAERMFCNPEPCPVEPKPKKERFATCAMRPNEDLGTAGTVRGLVTFKQEEHGSLVIYVNVTGFQAQPASADPNVLDHGFHVHEYGDLSQGCGSAGGHFNPKNARHGGRQDSVRHVGDLGNIRQSPGGDVGVMIVDERASLFGDNTVIGRALVIHRDQDDLGRGGDAGSEATGNAGPRLACCVIGVVNEEHTWT